VEQYYLTVERLRQAGFDQYELSNFARPGFESRHNQAYWERRPYRGFGVGACSFDGLLRFQNEKNLLKYFKSMEQGCTAFNFVESLSVQQIWLEKIMLGMRSAKGVSVAELQQHLVGAELEKFNQQLDLLQAAEFIVVQQGRLYLTPKGLSIENEVVVRLSV
jgi:oxygen-independent coproporphyrinogen-3 oxidase